MEELLTHVDTTLRFKNTNALSPAAIYFEQNGYYTNAVEGTKRWEAFWDEEKRRCIEGYEAEGIRITGYHYFYLNYFRIDRSVEVTEGKRTYKKREFFRPDFYDGDYDFFWIVEIARKGIDKVDLDALNLSVEIHPDDIEGERQLTVLKARRKGYSYKCASMLARNYFHLPRSKNFVFAFDKKYLSGDGIFQKFLDGMAFVDKHTAWAQPKLVDREAQMEIKSGYKKVKDGKEVTEGMQSLVQGISLKDNPDGARGKAGELVLFEEMGKFPGLKKAWDVTHHTVKEGKDALGIMIAFGTGGTEGADFQGAEELFYEPEENDCMRIRNQWDEGAEGTYCGHFVPIYKNLRGFIDEFGNSLVHKAVKYEGTQRAKKKKSKGSNTYSQYIAETPIMPREAIMTFDTNLFPTQQIAEQKNRVLATKRFNIGTPGFFYQDSKDGIKFKIDMDATPISKFPHSKTDDTTGSVVIYEAPVKVGGDIPNDLYIICHDPYAQDSTAENASFSLGSAYVIKRTNNFSSTYNECIVASYVGRPATQDDYNRQLFMLAEYYNAKIGFENDRGDVIGFARRHKKLHLLQPEFKFMDTKELQGKTRRSYGMNMTAKRKEQGELYVRDWLLSKVSKNAETEEETLVLHTIVDVALLEELIKFNKKGNFDRVLSLFVGMYHLKEKYNQQVEAVRKTKHDEFFNRIAS
jgi:hypothetical protein